MKRTENTERFRIYVKDGVVRSVYLVGYWDELDLEVRLEEGEDYKVCEL
jgi:hypothetical protein